MLQTGARIRKPRRLLQYWQMYLLLLPGLIWLFVFCYYPMYGVTIAFKNFSPRLGILQSEWAGLKYFNQFFSTSIAAKTIGNTLALSALSIVLAFPAAVIFALLLNTVEKKRFKKLVQTTSFAPHFISVVVLVSMMNLMFSPTSGFVNKIIVALGGTAKLFTAKAQYFRMMYVLSGIWQGMGFGAIVYLAALSGVSPELHEAAIIDGASRLRRIWHVDLPAIVPTIVIMLTLSIGGMFNVGWEKVLLMQNPLNTSVSEIISTYTYKVGMQNAKYSFSAAVGLFNSACNFILLFSVNMIAKKLSNTSLF